MNISVFSFFRLDSFLASPSSAAVAVAVGVIVVVVTVAVDEFEHFGFHLIEFDDDQDDPHLATNDEKRHENQQQQLQNRSQRLFQEKLDNLK